MRKDTILVKPHPEGHTPYVKSRRRTKANASSRADGKKYRNSR